MRANKLKALEANYGSSIKDLLIRWYTEEQMSTPEIAGKVFREVNVPMSPRFLQKTIKKMGLIRDFSSAFRLAIQKGRKDYSHMRKPIKAGLFRRGITLKVRYMVLKRDNFRCALCGAGAQDARLEIDHIIPVVQGGANDPANLRVLCIVCNRGKKTYERER